MCEEWGFPWELGENKPWNDKIYSVNPVGNVPILIYGGFQIYKSAAILNYLAETYQRAAGVELVPLFGKKRAYND